MKTLQLVDGDLVVGQGGYTTVTGSVKLHQDLGIAVRDPYGVDRFHPRWGSMLPSYIGDEIGANVKALVDAEVGRVIQNYIAVQRDKRQQAALQGLPNRYGSDEIINRVTAIEVNQRLDRLGVRVFLTTLAQEEIVLNSTVVL